MQHKFEIGDRVRVIHPERETAVRVVDGFDEDLCGDGCCYGWHLEGDEPGLWRGPLSIEKVEGAPRFKVGDEVVSTWNSGMGRPVVRKIEMVEQLADGRFRYRGGRMRNAPEGTKPFYTWAIGEDSLVPASEYQWPSEFEMRVMDRKARESFEKSFEEVARHHEEEE